MRVDGLDQRRDPTATTTPEASPTPHDRGEASKTIVPDGASVYVGEALIGTTPIAGEVYVEPGDHAVRAEKSGFVTGTESESLIPGDARDISLTLAASGDGGGGGGGGGPTEPTEPGDDGKNPIIIGVGLGVGAVAIGVGIGLAVAAGGSSSDAEALHEELGASATQNCPDADATKCGELADARSSKDTLHNVSMVTFIAGGAVLVGTLVYVLWPGGEPAAEASIGRVAPVVGPSQAGLSWSGAF